MIKKIVCVFLALLVFLSAFSINASAEGESSQKEFIYLNYTDNEYMLENLFAEDSALGYWSLVNEMSKNKTLSWAIDVSSKLIDQYPDYQDYAEILANLIMMQSGILAEQIQTQSKFDDLKDGIDYVMDIVDIAENFIGANNLLDNISPIIDAALDGKDVIIENFEYAKYYQVVIQDYSQAHDFLSAVSRYANDEELRNVASSLLSANDLLLEERIEYLLNTTDSLANYEAKFFIKNMSFELLKKAELYRNDATVKWYVDCGAKLKDSVLSLYSTFDFTFKMMMLVGDIGFGTSDTFYRYQEMKIITDIAGAIVKANNTIKVSRNKNDSRVFDSIQMKCNYYKMLITTHARGEYLIYKLLTSDAGVLSEIRVIFDYFKKTEDTTKNWYDNQIEIMLQYHSILNEILCEYPIVVSLENENSDELYYESLGNAFDTYLSAVEKTTESGSWTEELEMTVNMVMTKGSSKTKTKVTLDSYMDISNYSQGELSNLCMSGDVTMSVMGQTYAWNMLYEDGTAHYQYTEPNQTSADVQIDPNYFDFISFTNDAMSNVKVEGNQIKFTIQGDKMTEIGLSAVKMMNGITDLEYGDVNVIVTTNKKGGIDKITMKFDASLMYQWYDTEADYEVQYQFS